MGHLMNPTGRRIGWDIFWSQNFSYFYNQNKYKKYVNLQRVTSYLLKRIAFLISKLVKGTNLITVRKQYSFLGKDRSIFFIKWGLYDYQENFNKYIIEKEIKKKNRYQPRNLNVYWKSFFKSFRLCFEKYTIMWLRMLQHNLLFANTFVSTRIFMRFFFFSFLFKYMILRILSRKSWCNVFASFVERVFKRLSSDFGISICLQIENETNIISAEFFARFIVQQLQFGGTVKKSLYYLENILSKYLEIAGFKICIVGRFARHERATYVWVKQQTLSLNRVAGKVIYGIGQFINKYGMCGVKVWVQLN
jgi:hypothetical protein